MFISEKAKDFANTLHAILESKGIKITAGRLLQVSGLLASMHPEAPVCAYCDALLGNLSISLLTNIAKTELKIEKDIPNSTHLHHLIRDKVEEYVDTLRHDYHLDTMSVMIEYNQEINSNFNENQPPNRVQFPVHVFIDQMHKRVYVYIDTMYFGYKIDNSPLSGQYSNDAAGFKLGNVLRPTKPSEQQSDFSKFINRNLLTSVIVVQTATNTPFAFIKAVNIIGRYNNGGVDLNLIEVVAEINFQQFDDRVHPLLIDRIVNVLDENHIQHDGRDISLLFQTTLEAILSVSLSDRFNIVSDITSTMKPAPNGKNIYTEDKFNSLKTADPNLLWFIDDKKNTKRLKALHSAELGNWSKDDILQLVTKLRNLDNKISNACSTGLSVLIGVDKTVVIAGVTNAKPDMVNITFEFNYSEVMEKHNDIVDYFVKYAAWVSRITPRFTKEQKKLISCFAQESSKICITVLCIPSDSNPTGEVIAVNLS